MVTKIMKNENSKFCVDINKLLENNLHTRKHHVKDKLKRQFTINEDYQIKLSNTGKHNKEDIFLTRECYSTLLLKALANSRTMEFPDIVDEIKIIKHIRPQEIYYLEFVQKAFADFESKMQFVCESYKIDLYFTQKNLAIECDEKGHKDRALKYEQNRENQIKRKLSCKFYRFNPDCTPLSKVMHDLICIFFNQ